MSAALVNCPKCKGRGRPRFPNDALPCDLCQGQGSLSDDFAEATAAPRREGIRGSCDHCGDVGTCLPVEGAGITRLLCSRDWTREWHPELLEPAVEPAFP